MNMILKGTVIDSNQPGDRPVDRDRLVGHSCYIHIIHLMKKIKTVYMSRRSTFLIALPDLVLRTGLGELQTP